MSSYNSGPPPLYVNDYTNVNNYLELQEKYKDIQLNEMKLDYEKNNQYVPRNFRNMKCCDKEFEFNEMKLNYYKNNNQYDPYSYKTSKYNKCNKCSKCNKENDYSYYSNNYNNNFNFGAMPNIGSTNMHLGTSDRFEIPYALSYYGKYNSKLFN